MARSSGNDAAAPVASSPRSFISAAVRRVLSVAGLAAIVRVARKLKRQAPTAMAPDWSKGLAHEHAAVLAVIDEMAGTSDDHAKRRAGMLSHLKQILTRHAMQEELVIYPALRRGNDAETTDRLNQDHGEVKAMLYELGHMDKDDPDFSPTLKHLRSLLEGHMREEETTLFPALQERLTDEENRKLARDMNMAGLLLA